MTLWGYRWGGGGSTVFDPPIASSFHGHFEMRKFEKCAKTHGIKNPDEKYPLKLKETGAGRGGGLQNSICMGGERQPEKLLYGSGSTK